MIFRLFLLALWLVMFKNWSRSSSLQSALRTYFALCSCLEPGGSLAVAQPDRGELQKRVLQLPKMKTISRGQKYANCGYIRIINVN